MLTWCRQFVQSPTAGGGLAQKGLGLLARRGAELPPPVHHQPNPYKAYDTITTPTQPTR